jgi:hypothetical protein
MTTIQLLVLIASSKSISKKVWIGHGCKQVGCLICMT